MNATRKREDGVEKQSVYIETSVVSYLTARPSRNLVVAAWQSATVTWWEERRAAYRVYASNLVIREASLGDSTAAARRLEALRGFPLLPVTEEIVSFSEYLIACAAIPEKAADDALHISIAAVHGTDILLTWNCRHIDNAKSKPAIRRACIDRGYASPEICTPFELMEI